MYSYRQYCYVNGKLEWMISSYKSFDTKVQAINDARETAQKYLPRFSHGKYEEKEDGAETWFSTPNHDRIHMKYVVI